jgi:GNAT superfamily N-acetyltransferase
VSDLPEGLRLYFEEPTSPDSYDELTRAMVAHQAETYGEAGYTPLGLCVRDAHGELHAGLTARLRWGWLYVEMLWVCEPLRGRGIGAGLLARAEEFARGRGGVAVHLTSGGTRALPFYARQGYEVVAEVEGFPPGSTQHHLRKWLDRPAAR